MQAERQRDRERVSEVYTVTLYHKRINHFYKMGGDVCLSLWKDVFIVFFPYCSDNLEKNIELVSKQ